MPNHPPRPSKRATSTTSAPNTTKPRNPTTASEQATGAHFDHVADTLHATPGGSSVYFDLFEVILEIRVSPDILKTMINIAFVLKDFPDLIRGFNEILPDGWKYTMIRGQGAGMVVQMRTPGRMTLVYPATNMGVSTPIP